jgi:hypothetical protein
MKILNLTLMFALLVAPAVASDVQGTEPRAEASRYPASAQQGQVSIGAQWLTAEQTRRAFAMELHSSVLVVELAIFPGTGAPINISRSDFAVRSTGSEKTSKPLYPRSVALTAERPSGSGIDTDAYEQVGIGIERGERIDPDTGQREGKVTRIYTSTGTGVTVRSKGGQPTERELEAMERELSDKGLPEGIMSRPVAGYLYFSFPDKKKIGSYDLECRLGGVRMVVPLRTSR